MSTISKKAIIIGAGGFGREVYRYLLDLQKVHQEIEIEGFLDNNFDALRGFSSIEKPIIGNTDFLQVAIDKFYVCAIGDVNIRASIFDKVKLMGGHFFTIIHPSVRISASCSVDEGAIICPGAILTDNVKIGKNVIINLNVMCGHDVEIGDHSILCPMVNINGNVNVYWKVFIGSSAVLTPGTRIGEDCKISAGSVVYKTWGANLLLHGNPAKKVNPFS